MRPTQLCFLFPLLSSTTGSYQNETATAVLQMANGKTIIASLAKIVKKPVTGRGQNNRPGSDYQLPTNGGGGDDEHKCFNFHECADLSKTDGNSWICRDGICLSFKTLHLNQTSLL